jgi:hypothetical protein
MWQVGIFAKNARLIGKRVSVQVAGQSSTGIHLTKFLKQTHKGRLSTKMVEKLMILKARIRKVAINGSIFTGPELCL